MSPLVSVPIRGSFNLTKTSTDYITSPQGRVSVPIRGLFNLTGLKSDEWYTPLETGFRPHQGII